MSDPFVKRSGYVVPVSREMLLDAGMVEPTPEEHAEAERAAAETRRLAEERAACRRSASQALAALDDPLARAILDLHAEDERGECRGCDFDGYEAERPDWPCRTVEVVAKHYGIDMDEVWQ